VTHSKIAAAALAVALSAAACEAEEKCDQAAVDACYAEQGCPDSTSCSMDLTRLNALCVCLGGLGCDHMWYHELCDEAPYDAGTCPICSEE